MLPESGTLAILPAEHASPTMAQPLLPITCELLSEESLLPLTAEDLLPVLRTAYPNMSPAILRHSWLNGAPFLGVRTDRWPPRTYHFPGMGEVPPISVIPTASLVTAPFLSETNTFTWTPAAPIAQQPSTNAQPPQLSLPSAAVGASTPSIHAEPPTLAAITYADFGLAPNNASLFTMPSTATDMPNFISQASDQFDPSLGQVVSEVLGSATQAATTVPTTTPGVVTTSSIQSVAPLFSLPQSTISATAGAPSQMAPESSSSRHMQQLPTGTAAPRPRLSKRPGSGRSESTHAKRRSHGDTRQVVHRSSSASSSRHSSGGASAHPTPSDQRVSSSDPLLSTTSSRRPNTQSRTTMVQPEEPTEPTVQISSESSDE